MELTLERIEQKVGAQTYLYPLDLTLVPRAVTVLLGATQAGKTTLMRVMAGLDVPFKGRVLADGVDVTGQAVRERSVAWRGVAWRGVAWRWSTSSSSTTRR